MKGEKRRIELVIPVILVVAILINLPTPVEGDGCYIPVGRFEVYEPGQFGIVCWNGTVERLYLSVNIWGEGESDGVHLVPFPSLPEVSLGNISVFENLTDVFERRLSQSWEWDRNMPDSGGGAQGSPNGGGGYQIEFEDTLGVHDVTVIRVVDIDQFKNGINLFLEDMVINTWPEGMDEIVEGYVERGFPFFAIDRFSIGKKPKDIQPLIYEFETNKAVFPLEISSLLDGRSSIKIGCLVPSDLPIDLSGRNDMIFRSEGSLSRIDLMEISLGLEEMFGSSCLALYFDGYLNLKDLEGDFLICQNERADWMTTFRSYYTYSSIDDQGRPYERILTSLGHKSDGTDTLTYIDPRTGYQIWERIGDLGGPGSLGGRSLFLKDIDHDGREDIFVTDYNRTHGRISKLDPFTGDTLWSTTFQSEYNGVIEYLGLMDPGGKNQIALNHRKGIAVLDLDSGSIISRLYGRFKYSWVEEVTILATQSGDNIVYIDPYDSTFNVWGPWTGSQGTQLVREKYDKGYWPTYDSFHLGRCSYFISRSGDHITIITVNNELCVSMCHFQGIYIGWKEQSHQRNRPMGLFYRETNFGTYEIFAMDLVDCDILWIKRNNTSPRGTHPFEIRSLDLNGDGTDEIILNWFPYFREGPDGMEIVAKITVHDEMTGEVIWESNNTLVDLGTDSNRNGLNELLIEDIDHIILVEPLSNNILTRIPKNEHGLSYSFTSGDLNSDGYDDSLFMITRSRSYWSAPWKYIEELVFLDGFTKTFESFTTDLGAITNAWGSTNEKGEDTLIVSTYRRLYCFPLESRLQLISDKRIIGKGSSTELVVNAANLNGPMINASVEWGSDVDGGSFSTTKEVGPGMYMTNWTSPENYAGKVTLTVKVDNGEFAGGSHIFLEVIDGISVPRSNTTGIDVSVTTFPTRVMEGGVVSITASIEGNFLEENLDLSLYEIIGMGEELEMIRIADTLWTVRYWPRGSTGERVLVFRAVINGILVHEEYLKIMLLEPKESMVDERIVPIIQLGISTGTVPAFSSIPVVVLVSRIDMTGDAMLRAYDHGSGGSFTQFKELFPGMWSANYTAPETEGNVLITVFIEMNGQKLAEDSDSLKILANDEMVLDKGELILHHEVFDLIENGDNTKHILISPTRDGLPVLAEAKFVYITEGSWSVEIIDDRIGNLIHLKVVQKRGYEGFLMVDINDGKSIVPFHISLIPVIQESDEPIPEISKGNETEMDEIMRYNEKKNESRAVFIILMITLICAMSLMGVTIFMFYMDRKDRNVHIEKTME